MTSPATALALDPSQVARFYEDGFVRVDQVFTPDEMDQMDQAFERLYATSQRIVLEPHEGAHITYQGSKFTYNPTNNFVRHIAYCGNAEPALLEFGRDPRLLAIAGAILGSDQMDHLINQAHYKRPGSAVKFDWHQDSMHRGIEKAGFLDVKHNGSYVQIALAIDDATPENGPLEFIPGTNKLGHLGADVASRIDVSKRVAPMLKRGDVVAFGPYTVHGSEANLSARSRRVFINGFAYPGANQKSYHLPNSGERLTYHAGR